jgi:hypothetical protein
MKFGQVDYVTNPYDRAKYGISTLTNPLGFHETAVVRQ